MKVISNHFKYASNIWLTSATITPCIFGLILAILGEGRGEGSMIIALAIPFGIILSLPNYLIFLWLIWQINKTKMTPQERKVIINILGVILTFALFMLIFFQIGQIDKEALFLGLGYSSTITFGVWYFNLERTIPNFLFEEKYVPQKPRLENILDDNNY